MNLNRRLKRLNKENMIKIKLLYKIFFPLILIGLWFVIYFFAVDIFEFWKPYAFPNPIDTFKILIELCRKNLLISAIFQSMKRIFIGYSISIFIGGVVGFLIYKFFIFSQIFKPFILGLQSMPSICWVPFAILWFGLGESSIIFVVVMGSLFSVATTFESSIKNVKPLYIKAARTMGISEKKLFFKVIIPASIPSIVIGMKQSWAFAWRALLSAEVMSATIGLGQLLIMGRNLADINQVVLIMIIIVFIGILFDKLIFSSIEKSVLKKNGMI